MLAFVEVSSEIEELDSRSRALGLELIEALGDRLPEEKVRHGTEILGRPSTSHAFVVEGCLKLEIGDKLVRLFNRGNVVCVEDFGESPKEGTYALRTEFAARLVFVDRGQLAKFVLSDPALAAKWSLIQDLDLRVLAGVCAAVAPDDRQPTLALTRFEPGAAILTEGEHSDSVFILLEGRASAHVGGVEVGEIHTGEVFGEIGFLTDSPAGATVIADESCLVQSVRRSDFEVMARARPELMMSLSRSLAERLARLNNTLFRASIAPKPPTT